MWKRILGRSLSALSLALGVTAILFVVFDSGLLGDPALVGLGQHRSASGIGRERLRLGLYAEFEASVATWELQGPPARFYLEAESGALVLRSHDGAHRWVQEDLNRPLEEGLGHFEDQLSAETHWRLLRNTTSAATRDASGLHAALGQEAIALDTGRRVNLPWARAVPAWKRFLTQFGRLLSFDFGQSRRQQSIAAELGQRAWVSLSLALPAFLMATALSVGAALVVASRRARFDRGLLWFSSAVMALPSLVVILLLQGWLAGGLGWFPIHGFEPPYVSYLVLPILIWALIGLGSDYRFHRGLVLEELNREHVRVARAKGLDRSRVLQRHVLLNASIPILSQAMVVLPFLFLGSLLLETFFGIPGLGSYTVQAVFEQDHAVLRATTFLFAMGYLAAQWLADLSLYFLDPRLRHR